MLIGNQYKKIICAMKQNTEWNYKYPLKTKMLRFHPVSVLRITSFKIYKQNHKKLES